MFESLIVEKEYIKYHDKNGVIIRIEKTNIVSRGEFIMVEYR